MSLKPVTLTNNFVDVLSIIFSLAILPWLVQPQSKKYADTHLLSQNMAQIYTTSIQEVLSKSSYSEHSVASSISKGSLTLSPITIPYFSMKLERENSLDRSLFRLHAQFSGTLFSRVGCEQCKGPHYTKDCPLKEEGKTLEEVYYTQFSGPFQGVGYRVAALGFYQRNNVNPSYQERRQSRENTLSKFMSESAKSHEENSNLIKAIRASTDATIRNQGASIKTLETQIGQISKVLQKRGFGSLPSSTKANLRDQVKSISTTIEADSYSIPRIH
ncbi:hypothetical protein Tco_0805625 [Tanacetum coccineum]